MADEWRKTTLGEVCQRQGGSIQTGPFGSQLHASDYTVAGTPVVMPVNLIDGNIKEQGIARVSADEAIRLARHKLIPGDIVFSRRGDVTRFALVSEREAGWLCGTGCLKVSVGNPMIATPDFIAVVLASPESKEWLIRHAVGATMPNLNTEILASIPVVLPSLEKQQAIAHTLGTLDDKIELNRRMNQTLEAMARALFKSWFMDFDGVPAEDMQESELGLIPKGWRVGSLGDFTGIKNGYAFRRTDWQESGVPVVKIGSVKPAFVDLEQVSSVSHELANTKKAFQLNVGDMLVGLTGYVGETGRIPPTKNPPMLNQRVGKFEPHKGCDAFVFACVRTKEFKEFAIAKSHGSAQANVSTSDLLIYPTPLPNKQVIRNFCEIVSPIYEKQLKNQGEILALAQIRDILLPKLISGEIMVAEATAELKGY